MKSRLKQNGGFALTAVIALLFYTFAYGYGNVCLYNDQP